MVFVKLLWYNLSMEKREPTNETITISKEEYENLKKEISDLNCYSPFSLEEKTRNPVKIFYVQSPLKFTNCS